MQALIYKAFDKSKSKSDLLKGIEGAIAQMPKENGKEVTTADAFPQALASMVDKAYVFEAAL